MVPLAALALQAAATVPDPKALAKSFPATMPRIIAGQIEQSDYPRQALREGLEGETRAMLTVSATGRVTRCRIARSSGWEMLDARACEVALTRMQLAPALDEGGKAIEVEVVLPVVWRLEEAPKR